MRHRQAGLTVQTSTLAGVAVSTLVAACATHPLRAQDDLPMPPRPPHPAVGYVQLGNRLEGTRFVTCEDVCPMPTIKVPMTEEDLALARAARSQPLAALAAAASVANSGDEARSSSSGESIVTLVRQGDKAHQQPATSSENRERSSVATDPGAATSATQTHVVDVLFLNNKDSLGPLARRQVLYAAHFAPLGSSLRVMGRTDAPAHSAAAERLAANRAKAVAEALRRAGVTEDRIQVSSLSWGDWVGNRNSTAVERGANRRAIVAALQAGPSVAHEAPADELSEAQYTALVRAIGQ